MSGDCFWTALVNCFDDCGAAPPPPPPLPPVALREDFDSPPSGRAPSGGPLVFNATTPLVGVTEGGLYRSSSPTNTARVSFGGAGPTDKLQPTRVFRVGLQFNPAVASSYAAFSIEVGESLDHNDPRVIAGATFLFFLDGSTYVDTGSYAEAMNSDYVTTAIASASETTVSLNPWATPNVTQEMRLEIGAFGFRCFLGETAVFAASWSMSTVTRALTPRDVSASVSRAGIAIDYIQLDLDE